MNCAPGVQQRAQRAHPGSLAEGLADADQLAPARQAVRCRDLDEGAVARGAGGELLRTGHVGDPAVAERHEMRDRGGDSPVVVADDGRSAVLVEAVEQHERRGPVELEEVILERRGRGDPAVDLAQSQRVHDGSRALRVVVGVGDQRGEAGRQQRVLDSAHHRREQRIGEVGEDHADRHRSRGLQAARDRVGRVAHLERRLGDLRDGRGADEVARLLVEGPRRGRRVDPHATGHVPQGERAGARRPIGAPGHGSRMLAAISVVEPLR